MLIRCKMNDIVLTISTNQKTDRESYKIKMYIVNTNDDDAIFIKRLIRNLKRGESYKMSFRIEKGYVIVNIDGY